MCNDCLNKGLWSHEENKELDRFINGFSRKKKPSYRTAKKPQENSPVAEEASPLPDRVEGTEPQKQ